MNRSKRHHYIPKFLLHNFTNADGQLYVYDKKADRIIKNPRHPGSIFFKLNLNTAYYDEDATDAAEHYFARLDTKFAAITSKAGTGIQNLTEEDKTFILAFIAFLILRNPRHLHIAENAYEDHDISEFGFRFINRETGEEVDTTESAQLQRDPLLRKLNAGLLSGIWAAGISNSEFNRVLSNTRLHVYPSNPAVISDNIVTLKNTALSAKIQNFPEFICPLSNSSTLVYFLDCREDSLRKGFLYFRDTVSIWDADQYAACPDRSHLEKTVQVYRQIVARFPLLQINPSLGRNLLFRILMQPESLEKLRP